MLVKVLMYILILGIIIFFIYKRKINLLTTLICSIIILAIMSNPNICINSAISGAKIFFYSVFPCLFFFLVICNIIIDYNGVNIYSKLLGNIICTPMSLPKKCSFSIVVSILCGYPLGAKYACKLYEDKLIDFKICEKLINIASNPSPLFIIGTVGTVMLKNTYLGYILLISCYLSCFIMGLIIKTDKKSYYWGNWRNEDTKPSIDIGISLQHSVSNAITTSFSVGGFIVLFSVLTSIIQSNTLISTILNNLNSISPSLKVFIQGCFIGIIEMTNGCFIVSISNLSVVLKVVLISFLLSFSGLSIISQVYSITSKHKFSLKTYVTRKIIQGIITSIISLILLKIPFNEGMIYTFNTFHCNYTKHNGIVLVFVLLVLPFIVSQTKKLFHIS